MLNTIEMLEAIEKLSANDAIETDCPDNEEEVAMFNPQIPEKYRVSTNPFGLESENVFANPNKPYKTYAIKSIAKRKSNREPMFYKVWDNRPKMKYYFTGNSIDLLNCIEVGYPERPHNAFGKANNGWYCPDIQVAFITDNGQIVKLADNPFDRYCKLIAKKWALFRDWVPTYRYSQEDLQSIIAEVVFTELGNGTPIEEINSIAYKRLDAEYRAFPNYKTIAKEEIQSDLLRGLFAELFTGNLADLPNQYDMNGKVLPNPTDWKGNLTDGELIQVVKLKAVFDKAKEMHNFAPIQTWKLALWYCLGVDTDRAIQELWGESGKKKTRSHKNTYSASAMRVIEWLKEAIKELDCKGYEKWEKAMTIERLVNECNETLERLVRANKLNLDREQMYNLKKFIIAEPKKALGYLVAIR